MERQWSGNARRLRRSDRAEDRESHLGGSDVRSHGRGCRVLDEIDSAISGTDGWAEEATQGALAAASVVCGTRRAVARLDCR